MIEGVSYPKFLNIQPELSALQDHHFLLSS